MIQHILQNKNKKYMMKFKINNSKNNKIYTMKFKINNFKNITIINKFNLEIIFR